MSKYIVYAGRSWKQEFTVLSDDGVTGQTLDPTDTATISIISAGPTGECILDNIPMTVLDESNGLFEVELTAEQTALLKGKYGFQEDNYSPIGTHLGLLQFTLVSGDITTDIPIAVIGAAVCPTIP